VRQGQRDTDTDRVRDRDRETQTQTHTQTAWAQGPRSILTYPPPTPALQFHRRHACRKRGSHLSPAAIPTALPILRPRQRFPCCDPVSASHAATPSALPMLRPRQRFPYCDPVSASHTSRCDPVSAAIPSALPTRNKPRAFLQPLELRIIGSARGHRLPWPAAIPP
jgi:hypothetical protein